MCDHATPRLWHTRGVTRASLVLALTFVLGCGSSPPKTSTITSEPTAPTPAVAGDPTCPLLVPGTSISVEDTAEGPAFVFVTTGDVAAVRARGAALAEMNNTKNGPAGAFGMVITKPAEATASDIEGGVRVAYKPTNAADAGALGDELRMHGGHLAGATSCEMHH